MNVVMRIVHGLRRLRARAAPTGPDARPEPAPATEVDPDTGEILGVPPATRQRTRPARPIWQSSVAGERTIPSVNRERSVRARIAQLLLIGTLLLIGSGLLAWYYAGQYARAQDARAAAQKAAESRTAGELRLPPLGRIDPPQPPAPAPAPVTLTTTLASELLGPAPPVPAPVVGAATNSGPPVKSPEQLALERRLGLPVLLHASATSTHVAAAGAAEMASPEPGAPVPVGSPSPAPAPTSTTLGTLLRPTATPAVAAQLLPTRRFLLPKGAFVDCTLETAIDSTYDGMVTCIGANDVYGADGRVVLIERGSKFIGEKRGEIRQGQGRVFVLWNEARTPTGVSVALASPGTDELGRTGLPGVVDTHFWDRFGAAILISVIDGTVQAMAARAQNDRGSSNGGSGGTGIVLNPQGGRDVMTEVLRSTVAIPPTVVKNQGDRIQVLVARDVDFRSVYALRTDPDGR